MAQVLKGAVIGYGFISAKGHIPAYLEKSERFKIVAVADICEARRDLARRNLPEVRVYPDYRSLMNAEEDLDFIDICTPPSDHFEIAQAAMNKGLHVLCEKPLTTNLECAQALVKHAELSKRVLFPCHNYKHAPVVQVIREIIESGEIGKVRSVTLNTFRNTHARGVNEWNTHWRRQVSYSGGGIAMDHGSHSFYLTFDWLGAYPTAVTAKMSRMSLDFDTEDNFSSVLTFPNGLAHCHLTWTAGVRKVIYTVQGEKGAITVDDDHLELSLVRGTEGEDVAQGNVTWEVEKKKISSHWMDSSHVGWYRSLYDQFVQAIEEGAYVGKEAREAVLCIEVITSAYESAKENCKEVALSTQTF